MESQQKRSCTPDHHQPYKHWPKIFNNDSTLTSAVLDHLPHHAEIVIIEGKSYRMKDQIETPQCVREPRPGGRLALLSQLGWRFLFRSRASNAQDAASS